MRAPVAAYAAVLDGRHLWLALDRQYDGGLALKPASGDAIPLEAERTQRWLECRADLATLLPPHDATYDVVLKTSRLKPAKPVHGTPVPSARTTAYAVERADDGHLVVRRRAVPPTAELETVELRGDRVHLRIAHGVEVGCHLMLLDQDDALLETLPVTAHDGHLEALVGIDDLPAGYFGMLRLAVGTPERPVRIRRRDDDLADANRAVLLPELLEDDEIRARFRWNLDGLLAVRHLAPGEQP
jgi:hypothetical protein